MSFCIGNSGYSDVIESNVTTVTTVKMGLDRWSETWYSWKTKRSIYSTNIKDPMTRRYDFSGARFKHSDTMPLTDIPAGCLLNGCNDIVNVATSGQRLRGSEFLMVEAQHSFDVDTGDSTFSVTLMNDFTDGETETYTMPYAKAKELRVNHSRHVYSK